MNTQNFVVVFVALVFGLVVGYGLSSNESQQPITQRGDLEQKLVVLTEKIENIDTAVDIITSNSESDAAGNLRIVEEVSSNEQKTLAEKESLIGKRSVKSVSVNSNLALASVSAEEKVVVNRLIQDIGDKNLTSNAVLGSENMQSMSPAAQNMVMAEITRRLNSGELQSEQFFGAEYPSR